jgi:hypothetical protein
VKTDVQNLAAILKAFGDVIGLCTNFQKSSVVPIRCGQVDMDDILHGIPVERASFPIKYLGLPLTMGGLKSAHLQPLADKAAAKVPAWNGKYVTTAGRTALVKSVLAAQSIFHLTTLVVPPKHSSMHQYDIDVVVYM